MVAVSRKLAITEKLLTLNYRKTCEDFQSEGDDYSKEIKHDPSYSFEGYINRGCDYLLDGKFHKAIEEFDKGISIDPNFASAYGIRGNAYMNLGHCEIEINNHNQARKHYRRAIRDYNHGLKINPSNYMLYYNRGRAFSFLGLNERAIQDYDHAIKLNSEYLSIYNDRGISYMRLRKYQQAVNDFDHILKLAPNDDQAIRNRNAALSALTPSHG